ncbi:MULTISPECIES: cell division ATP-binding protein FtsE [Marinomonas]|uniref:Cell division ATP-binding protein FtsE n=2 Tax=Marinomonas TaxID=28253 RepID=A0A7H1J622_9GAMM|nr:MULTISPECIES: cell division ATP-binding protein FtsE [Marinomonas]MCS7484928.1 ABC transporter [Marinomonas sp. BSi20414]MCW4630152.1 cell division ATP-binding protein FtsE [Marinomonas sp. KJ51-3]QNT05938.1 cell division ATP-binding protein FtsE [Marinomonas arctica]GGN20064.1 cell division ATP-binding protein FtsE [Marinomonas arctica]
MEIEFQRVGKKYESGQEALSQVSFHLQQGEMAFLTGHSGAGKSTLMKLMMMIERQTSGQILVDGVDLRTLSRRAIPHHRRRVGVVFQNHQLLLDRSVFHNVALPLQVSGADSQQIAKRVRAALDKVGLLDKEKYNPMALSGGEQQRVGIARAVVNKPQLLLADEPTGNLDPKLSAEIMNLFQEFNRVGVTVLVASHDLALVARMRHRVLTLSQGRMVNDGGFA